MTKPKPAEFTDYASALKFLKSGRGKGGVSRPTADGWNTVCHVIDAHRIGLQLHGVDVIEYHDDGSLVVAARAAQQQFVTRQRVNKYAMEPRGYAIEPVGVVRVRQTLRGVNEWRWKTLVGSIASTNIVFDTTGAISGLGATISGPGMQPWRNVDRKIEWAKKAAVKYRANIFQITDGVDCPGCAIVDDDGQILTSLANLTGDQEHLIAHVMNMEFPGALLLAIGQWKGTATYQADLHWDSGTYGRAEWAFDVYLRYLSAVI